MFIDPSKIKGIYLYVDPIDFRKGIYGLCSYVSEEFRGEVNGKNLFVFCNRYRNKLRVLYWDDTGYALWHKALEKDKFFWPSHDEETMTISTKKLKWLLSGLSIQKHKKTIAKDFY